MPAVRCVSAVDLASDEFELRRRLQMASRPGEAFAVATEIFGRSGPAVMRLLSAGSAPAPFHMMASSGTAKGWWEHYLAAGLMAADPVFTLAPCQAAQAMGWSEQTGRQQFAGQPALLEAARAYGVDDMLVRVRPEHAGGRLLFWLGLGAPLHALTPSERARLMRLTDHVMGREMALRLPRRVVATG